MRVISQLAIVMLASVSPVLAQDKPAKRPITLEELNQRTVIGKLGLPLGTAAEIDAEVISGCDLRLKGYESLYLLKVTHVNGKKLDAPPLLRFSVPGFAAVELADTTFSLYEMKNGTKAHSLTSSQIAAIEKGYVGKSLRLLVYETGGFWGVPRQLPDDVSVWADASFHFSTSLIVLAQRHKRSESGRTKR